MISWMQKHKKYLVVTIWISTIAFVGAGFVGWGAYDFSKASSKAIAKVGSIEVTNKDLQEKYSKVYNYYNQMFGGKLTQEKAKNLKLDKIALQQLLNDALLLNYAKDLGLSVSKREVLEEIAKIPAFWVDGRFSESRYNSILRSLGTNSKEFKKSIKNSLIIKKLYSSLKLPNTPLEDKTIFSSLYIEDKLKIKVIKSDTITIQEDENELKDYWEKNRQKYKSQTKYLLDIVKVDPSTIKVNEDDLKPFYESKKYLFKDENGKILSFEKAKDRVLKELQMKLAKKEILKKYLKFKKHQIQKDDSITVTKSSAKIPMQKILKANKGDFIKAIKTEDGYICANVKDIILPKELTFQEAKEQVWQDLKSKKIEEELKNIAKKSLENMQNAKEIDFITRDDVDKLDFLSKPEAVEFLNNLFSNPTKKGYYLFSDKVVVYNIIEQKLFDKSLFEKNKTKISNTVQNLKFKILQEELLKKLNKMYKIEKYYKD